MTPYYEAGGVTIYHGDALAVLPLLPDRMLSAVIMDPPYASGARTEAQKSTKTHDGMLRGGRFSRPIENDSLTTAGFIWLVRETARMLRPRLEDGGSLLSFIDWRQWPNLLGALDSADFRINNMVVWDKAHFGLGYAFRHQHELVIHASKGTPRAWDHSVGTVIRCPRELRADHPSPKPVALLAKLVGVVAPLAGVVLDPFMGVGSTLVAAQLEGRQAIGIEVEERYCEVAARRLEQARQQSLPLEVPA